MGSSFVSRECGSGERIESGMKYSELGPELEMEELDLRFAASMLRGGEDRPTFSEVTGTAPDSWVRRTVGGVTPPLSMASSSCSSNLSRLSITDSSSRSSRLRASSGSMLAFLRLSQTIFLRYAM